MTVRRLIPLAALLLTTGLVFGQGAPPKKDSSPKEPAKPAPGSLEDTLDKALRNSADIKAAEAKVRDAEAELNRVRHQVLAKATMLHSDLNVARRMLEVAQAEVAETQRLIQMNAIGRDAILKSHAQVEKHKGEIEKIEAELKALRGEFALRNHIGDVRGVAFSPDGRLLAGAGTDGQVRVWDTVSGRLLGDLLGQAQAQAAPAAPGSMAERVRPLLDKEVEMQIGADTIPSAVHDLMALASNPAIPVRNTLPGQEPISINLSGKLSVGAWLQAIEDSAPNVSIVVREYGLLVTPRDRVPAGAIGVSELWKMKKAEPKGGPGLPGKH